MEKALVRISFFHSVKNIDFQLPKGRVYNYNIGEVTNMGIRDEYNFEYLVNESERLILEELERQLGAPENSAVCHCEDCVLDMAALALNSVRPLYRVSLMGTLYASALEGSPEAEEAKAAVSRSVKKIAANPSHGD